MECSKRQKLNNHSIDELYNLKIDEPDQNIYKKVINNLDHIAKPINGIGRFETLTALIGAITRTEHIDISKKAVIIMCSDNGIVEEGISQAGQEVTLAVAKNMSKKRSSVGRMAEMLNVDTIPVDIGINYDGEIPGVLNKKIRMGTRNFKYEPAMTEEETVNAIFTGIELVSEYKDKGYKILATGEMGIGNTTTSSAVAASLLCCDASIVTGRGAGLTDDKLKHKINIISEAIEKYKLYDETPINILKTVGGYDIAGLAGLCIGGALYHLPIVLDGVISMVAALIAERIVPGTVNYLIPSHKGKEPAVKLLSKQLGLEPVIDGNMALGEGTGAVMMFSLLDIALCIYQDQTTFSDIGIDEYKRLT